MIAKAASPLSAPYQNFLHYFTGLWLETSGQNSTANWGSHAPDDQTPVWLPGYFSVKGNEEAAWTVRSG